ncbi:MAG: folate-binding protein [Alphaproteobacteria bacterium]|nr:folate-binding protein [Alphaproteobacteria bacterium]MCZ6587090.1 folate-binding protein [Alphaproteobacteria bacterium]MCZ6840974.1 folate-binding protein [Alphaproteobacteria bacterium]
MTKVGYVKLDRGLVAITGADRQTFLQGLISQDVDRVSETRAAYGAFLTPQGKYLHDFCLAEIDDRLILDGEQGRADELIARMGRFKLRAKVDLAAADDLSVFAVFGENAPSLLNLAEKPGTARRLGDGLAFVDPRSAKLGCRLILPVAVSAAILADLPIGESTFGDYDTLRIRLGIPDGMRDMDVEKSILLECNFDSLNGIDWDKGCYIGQEVTARTKFRGLIKRNLVPVSVEGGPPAPGTAICADNKKVGEIRSIHDGFAIASLRLDAMESAELGLSLTADGAVISPLSTASTD